MTAQPHPGPTDYAIYRLFDAEGTLLYVGRARNPQVDIARQRARLLGWQAEIASHTIEYWRSSAQAYYMHKKAIRNEHPKHLDGHEHLVRPVHLYRLFDVDGGLLYVGQTSDLSKRLAEHTNGGSEFSPLIARSTSQAFPDRNAASVAERAAIASEHPRFNRNAGRGASYDQRADSSYDRRREIDRRFMAGGFSLEQALTEMVATGLTPHRAARMLTGVKVRGTNPSIAGIVRLNEGS